jgi:predicted permease
VHKIYREIEEELAGHFEEAVAAGRSPAEARQAFGSTWRHREASRDIRLAVWLDSLRADLVFGWRQLLKRKITSAAAILSLALGIGACTAAFRLIDALLLRPLPVADPHHLYAALRQGTDFDGQVRTADLWAYPSFRRMCAATKGRAELMAVSYTERTDVTYRSDQEIEKAYLQYVSGRMFNVFGLRPAVGRLLTENDDHKPGAHPHAVLSYDYWTRRFALDPHVIGRTLRMGSGAGLGGTGTGGVYEIVGVIEPPFTGTETGTVTDIFVPTMMHPGVLRDDWTWHRILLRLAPGVTVASVRAILHATSRAFEQERAKGFTGMSRGTIEKILDLSVVLESAAAGASGLQQDYRPALLAIAALVALVLSIACANVANLLTAQAAARSREMALRVSIGAGRRRLVQLALVESGIISLLSAGAGGLFAWWSAPFVVSRIHPPDDPAQLSLPADWRVLGFGLALTLAVTLLFGLGPALRAAAVSPAAPLKGGSDPLARRRSMHALIVLQAAFCFLVLFLAGLFVATFDRLAHRPTGFSPERLLNVETISDRPQPPVFWDQVAAYVRSVPGTRSVAIAGWPLLVGASWNGFISVRGAPPGPVLAYFLNISPGWIDTMKIPWVAGRDFRPDDTTPGVAIVNETFVKQFFNGDPPLGITFAKGDLRFTVIGVVRDAPYRDMREALLPVAYVPFHELNAKGGTQPVQSATLMVRTSSPNPLAVASILRREVARARPEFRVSNIRTQQEIDDVHTVRERLLAMLAAFFGLVALLLAAVGLYGVLDYSVLQRRRESGIRMAIGAPASDIARRVTAQIFALVLAGTLAGLALGLALVRYVEALSYEVKPRAPGALVVPSLILFGAALVAALPAVMHAVRIDPAATLHAD